MNLSFNTSQRKLGAQGLTVSVIGLGCMGMSDDAYGRADDTESISTIHRAVDLGVTLIDTAEQYGPFNNEILIGQALQGRRHQVVLSTKVGFRIQGNKVTGLDSRPDQIRSAVEGSLKRLQTDYLDILYQHRVDPMVPIEDVVGAMADLVSAGKVKYLGLSEAGAQTIRRAHQVHPISAIQSEYSLWERNLEQDILPLLRTLGIGLVAFSPLGRGFMAGTAKRAESYSPSDFRYDDPRLKGGNFDKNMAAAEAVRQVADAQEATTAQIALAWILRKHSDVVPIPGTKRRPHLENNLGALRIQLSDDEMNKLEASLASIAGPRYSEARMAMIDR
ncbi:aryl-alcohol dehydrogenase-like predicted oxidoreductase [Polaromonas sp. CG_9.11]|nr:aryl-alcohol dehydrogenase-like predicted oxidoreductase [Polaromonas sp. CG_9.11]